MVNILGLSNDDIKELISNYPEFGERRLQYGTLTTPTLHFEKVGYNFNINMMKPHMDTKRFNDYVRYYG